MVTNIAELIDKLSIVNTKLFAVCEKKALAERTPGMLNRDELQQLVVQDVQLCRERSALKNQINKFFGVDVAEEVKRYGG
jgi:hypothetical protein